MEFQIEGQKADKKSGVTPERQIFSLTFKGHQTLASYGYFLIRISRLIMTDYEFWYRGEGIEKKAKYGKKDEEKGGVFSFISKKTRK